MKCSCFIQHYTLAENSSHAIKAQTPSTARRVIIASILSPESIISSSSGNLEAYPIAVQADRPIGISMEEDPENEQGHPQE